MPNFIKNIIKESDNTIIEVMIVEKEIILSTDQMIYSIEELKKTGLSYYKIRQMVESGTLIKLNKSYYENTEFSGESLDFYYAAAYAPKGVVCLLSAAAFYNLTTYRPDMVDIAIQRKAKISTMPEWPQFSIFYFPDDRFETGISTVSDGKNEFKIYDIEKTIVDIVFYREKVGIEETKEVLVTYLQRKDRNLNRLLRYAESLKCADVMKTYLEVLV